jgi:hypothetical protein
MPTVLIGYHSDGGVVAFNGCYYLTYNDVGTGTAQWMITGASIFPLSFVPSAVNIAQYLTAYCYPRTSPYYYDTVQQLLVDYYDAVNRGEYATAYDLWTYPQQSYDNFVAGYADTTEVALFYGNFQFSGYYSTLDTGRIPVVLFGYHTDGSLAAYQGCIIMGYDQLRPGAWSIAGANLGQMAFTTTPSYTAIQQALGASCYPTWG